MKDQFSFWVSAHGFWYVDPDYELYNMDAVIVWRLKEWWTDSLPLEQLDKYRNSKDFQKIVEAFDAYIKYMWLYKRRR